MLSWLFKKRPRPQTPEAPPAAPGAPAAAAWAAASAAARSPPTDWQTQLEDAMGDDAALLLLARSAAPVDLKLKAVDALQSEPALKQAEAALRNRDRKVHQRVKQRLAAAVMQRESRASAERMIERATSMLQDAELPINHLVAIDREWAALKAEALDEGQRTAYAGLRSQLDVVVRAQAEERQYRDRWIAEAQRWLPLWQAELAAAADGGSAAEATALVTAVAALRTSRPGTAATVALDTALARLHDTAGQIEEPLRWLESVAEARVHRAAQPVADPVAHTGPDPSSDAVADAVSGPVSEPVAEPVAQSGAGTGVDAIQRWHALTGPLDGDVAQRLHQRFKRWQDMQLPPAPPPVPATAPAPRPRGPARLRAATADQLAQALAGASQAEAALAEGRVADLQRHLQAIEAALARTDAGLLPEALRTRLHALHTEQARLQDWQQWGGERARDDLADEAEALAPQTQAAEDTTLPAPRKLNLKEHGDAIHALRQRWKDLDRQRAPAAQPLWHRFDTALQAAYAPLARHQAAQKAERLANLAARQDLLAILEAVALPADAAAADRGADQAVDRAPHTHADLTPDLRTDLRTDLTADLTAAASAAPAAHPPAAPSADPSPDPGADSRARPTADDSANGWREPLRELERFQAAWRKLGPLEYTVPATARAGLSQRLSAAVSRIESPLKHERRAAAATRERLIAAAEALLPELARGLPHTEAVRQVRELQAGWQQSARSVPFPRAAENALWSRFKAATDAVFAQRAAAFAAREAEWAAAHDVRMALMDRLSSLSVDSAPAEMQRTLAEVDQAWRESGDLPRGDATEIRFRQVRAAALHAVAAAAGREWRGRCRALLAALAALEQQEDDGALPAEGGQPLAADTCLLSGWRHALAQRERAGAGAGPLPTAEVDRYLLELEAAWNLPTAPAWQSARRAMKLQALKVAMEARGSTNAAPVQPAAALTALIGQARLTPEQRVRLRAVVTALAERVELTPDRKS